MCLDGLIVARCPRRARSALSVWLTGDYSASSWPWKARRLGNSILRLHAREGLSGRGLVARTQAAPPRRLQWRRRSADRSPEEIAAEIFGGLASRFLQARWMSSACPRARIELEEEQRITMTASRHTPPCVLSNQTMAEAPGRQYSTVLQSTRPPVGGRGLFLPFLEKGAGSTRHSPERLSSPRTGAPRT